MKKLIGLLTVLTLVACGGSSAQVGLFDDAASDTPPVKKIVDDVPVPGTDAGKTIVPAADASPEADAGVDSSSPQVDAGADVQVDAAVDAPDSSDAALPPAPELAHPECECHQKMFECKQAFPDLNIDCGALATCQDTPYYTIVIFGTQVGHRDVVGDQRQGCQVLGVGALCCSH